MEEIIKTVGACGLVIILLILAVIGWNLEVVMPSTFKAGLVKVDDNISYNCKPTAKTIKYLKLQNEIVKLKKELNK